MSSIRVLKGSIARGFRRLDNLTFELSANLRAPTHDFRLQFMDALDNRGAAWRQRGLMTAGLPYMANIECGLAPPELSPPGELAARALQLVAIAASGFLRRQLFFATMLPPPDVSAAAAGRIRKYSQIAGSGSRFRAAFRTRGSDPCHPDAFVVGSSVIGVRNQIAHKWRWKLDADFHHQEFPVRLATSGRIVLGTDIALAIIRLGNERLSIQRRIAPRCARAY